MIQGKYRTYPTLAQDTVSKGFKHCGKCDKDKPVIEFGKRKRIASGYSSWCISCNRNYDRQYRAKFRPRKLREWYKRVYGIHYKEFLKILRKQGGLCGICEFSLDDPHLDHDPVTGRIRGILCHKCNCGLGMFLDDTAALQRAISYLEGN